MVGSCPLCDLGKSVPICTLVSIPLEWGSWAVRAAYPNAFGSQAGNREEGSWQVRPKEMTHRAQPCPQEPTSMEDVAPTSIPTNLPTAQLLPQMLLRPFQLIWTACQEAGRQQR